MAQCETRVITDINELDTKNEFNKKIAEFKDRKAKEKEAGRTTPKNKETQSEIKDKKLDTDDINESEINIVKNTNDEKYIYTLTCDDCSKNIPNFKPAKIELSEWKLDQLMSQKHKCGIGNVVVIDRKPLPFYNPKLENKFNPCKNKCWYNAKGDSFKKGGLECEYTAHDFLGCQDLVINDKLDKIGRELNIDLNNIKIEYKFNPCKYDCHLNADDKYSYKGQHKCPKTEDMKRSCQHLLIYNKIKKISKNGLVVNTVPNEVDVKYDNGHTVNVKVKDIWRLFVIRNCYSLQNKTDPDGFPVMKIKNEYGIGERLIDKNGNVYHEKYVLGDEPLTNKIIVDHLNGDITIGVHQINADSLCKWLCYDIDKSHVKQGTSEGLADTINKYLKDWYGLTGHKEKSGSVDSFHVWLFFEPEKMEKADKFDKAFKTKLKNEGVNIDDAEKAITGVGKAKNKDGKEKKKKDVYGKMIKLVFGKQNKAKDGIKGGKSEFLGDLSKIQPDILPEIE